MLAVLDQITDPEELKVWPLWKVHTTSRITTNEGEERCPSITRRIPATLRLEKAFGPKVETLMGMQSAYDIFQARRREGKIKVRPYLPAAVR